MKYPWQLILMGCLSIFGCTDSGGPAGPAADKTGGHVWQNQENAYRKAQDVAPMLEEADRRQRDALQQQGG